MARSYRIADAATRRNLFAGGVLAALLLVSPLLMGRAAGAEADRTSGTGTAPGTPALPDGVVSVAITRRDEPLFQAPDSAAPRRGTAALGARLPLFGAARGSGCQRRWLSVGPLAWVCEDVVELSHAPALAANVEQVLPADGLPFRYYFVGENGSLGYRDLLSAEQSYPDAELEPKFVVAVTTVRAPVAGDPFGLTTHELWVPLRDLRPAQPSLFRGVVRPEPDQGWVIGNSARVFERPQGRALSETIARLSPVRLLEERKVMGNSWFRIGENRWLRADDVTRASAADPPGLRSPLERWIDVDLEHQVLTAFEGTVPVFSTLVSSGRGKGDAKDATPKGEHRIWVKLRTSDMDNLENEDASRYYAIQSVPWVMYFDKGYGLHGAFWHRDFGHVRSHGCVNLSPLDAFHLFGWTSPHLPAGWTAVFPTEYERGTLVRVR